MRICSAGASWSDLSVYCCAVPCGFSNSANKPCLLLASLKASIFVPSFPLFLNLLEWVPQHSQRRYVTDNSVLLRCLNYTLNFRFGTDAIDPATVKAQVARINLLNVFHCKVRYVRVNPVCLGDKRLQTRHFKRKIVLICASVKEHCAKIGSCSVWKMRRSRSESYKDILYVHNYFSLTKREPN